MRIFLILMGCVASTALSAQSSISSFLGFQASDAFMLYSTISSRSFQEHNNEFVLQRGHLSFEDAGKFDYDQDGVLFAYDLCPNTTSDEWVDVNGCPQRTLEAESIHIETKALSCVDSADGSIRIATSDHSMSYTLWLNDVVAGNIDAYSDHQFEINTLESGSYTLCIEASDASYQKRCYELSIDSPAPLEVTAIEDLNKRNVRLELTGSKSYTLRLNGERSIVDSDHIELSLSPGLNTLSVVGELPCQGIFSTTYFVSEEVRVYPNPTQGQTQIYVGGSDPLAQLTIRNTAGELLRQQEITIPSNRVLVIDLSGFSNGFYLLELRGRTVQSTHKLIKE